MLEFYEKVAYSVLSGLVVIAFNLIRQYYRDQKKDPEKHEIWQVFKITTESINLYSGYNDFRTHIVRDYNYLINNKVEEMCLKIHSHRYMPNSIFRQFIAEVAAETAMQVTYELKEKFGPEISDKLKTASVTGRDRMYLDIESAIKNRHYSNNGILYSIFSDIVKYLRVSEKTNLVMHGMINGDLKGKTYTNYGGCYINE